MSGNRMNHHILWVGLGGMVLGSVLTVFITSDTFTGIVAEIRKPGPKTPFEWTDKNRDGWISQNEFRTFLYADAKNKNEKIRLQAKNTKTPPQPVSVTAEFTVSDADNDGYVSKEEFRAFLLAGAVQNTPQKSTSPEFAASDADGDGSLTKDEFKSFLLASASPVSPASPVPPAAVRTCGEAGHSDCPLKDMPEDVCCNAEFVWKNSGKTAGYKGPGRMAASKDGTTLYITHRDADEIAVFNTGENKIVRTIPVARTPSGTVLSGDEKTLFVTSGGYGGKLQSIDIESGTMVKEIITGHTPMSPVLLPDGKRIFVCNRFSNTVTEYELPEMKLVRTMTMIREPCAAVCTADGKKLYVANFLPNDPNNYPPEPHKSIEVAASVSVIDTETGKTEHIRLPNGSCCLQGICLSPDGQSVFATHLVSRFWNSTDKLDDGQMNGNGFSVLDTKAGYSKTVLLDDPHSGAANPWGIAVSPDGKTVCVTISGTDELMMIDIDKPDMKTRIKLTGKGARELVIAGGKIYAGMYYNDTLEQIGLTDKKVTEIPLGVKPELTQQRAGEMYWNDATLCLEQWQSCASCHPDGRMTGMNWDLLHDGSGNPKNTKSLLLSHSTPPAMWLGDRRHAMQCTRTGFRFILFTMPQREACFTIDEYTRTMTPLPSPYLIDGRLSAKAQRGMILFNDPKTGCVLCHPAPYFTDMKMYDVGSRDQYSEQVLFDTPTLVEVWRTAPYLHDGRYIDIKEVFTKGKHGNADGLTDAQLDDLIEYVLSL
jgi:YVTN family beta-propeller protein